MKLGLLILPITLVRLCLCPSLDCCCVCTASDLPVSPCPQAIGAKGGRYMEAQVQGSKQQAEEGTLVLLAAGDRSLFDDCQSCFQAVGKNSFYLGESPSRFGPIAVRG